MKATIPLLLLLSATLGFAEPAATGGASSPSEPPHAESAEPKPHAESAEPAATGGASSPSEPKPHAESAEAKPHAESAESAEPAATGGANSPSEPPPHTEPSASLAAKPRAPNPARCGGRCAQRPPLRAEVSLVDGSTLKGSLRQHALPARSPNLGDIRVRLGQVESIAFGKPGAPAKIAFRNGDALSAKFPADRAFVTMDTLVGRVRVPFDKVVSLSIEQPHSAFSTQHSALLYHCTFDSQAAVERPAAGPAGRFLGGEFVPGKNGKALRCPGNVPVAEIDLPERFLQPRGTIEFWAKIEEPPPSFPDRGNPRFFNLWLSEDGSDAGPCSTHLQFTANDGMGMSGLCGMIYHRAMATDPHMRTRTYRPLLNDPAAWHHYAIVWDSEGLPFAKSSDGTPAVATLVLDGIVLQTFGRNQLSKGEGLLKLPSLRGKLAFPVPSDRMEGAARSVPFLLDEFKIWSVVKTDFACPRPDSPIRHSAFGTQNSELLYHCTFDDAQSIERPAAGPAGTFLGGEFVPGKKGNALFVKAGTHAAEVPFPTGLMQPQGCIEFWGKIPGATKESTFPDGGNPQFFAMGVGKWVNTFVKYTSNDGFGTGGLHAGLPGSICVSTLPSWSGSARYPDFLGVPSAWHHYLLDWSDQGLDAASEMLGRRVLSALYVDGKLVNPSYGDNGPARAKFLRELVENPVVLAFPIVPGRQAEWQNRVDYMIDDFKIWSAPRNEKNGVSVRKAQTDKPELLYHCSFDDAEAIVHPVVGPAGTFLGGDFVPGKTGNALRVHADAPAAQTAFKPGDLGTRGTIEFWAKMEEATPETVFGDGGNPRFFCLWADLDKPGANPRSSYLQWSGNDGSGRSGLCAMVSGCTATSEAGWGTRRYPDFLGNPSDWHHYAVVWDENGVLGTSSVVAVYADGKLVSTGGRNGLGLGRKFKSFLEGPVLLGFPQRENEREPAARHVPFLIDEFKIWSAPKTDF